MKVTLTVSTIDSVQVFLPVSGIPHFPDGYRLIVEFPDEITKTIGQILYEKLSGGARNWYQLSDVDQTRYNDAAICVANECAKKQIKKINENICRQNNAS